MSVKANLNMVKKMNDKLYPKLSSNERFKFFIKSFVEENERETERLVNTCPQFHYRITDPAFTNLVEFSKDIVTIFILQFLEYDRFITLQLILEQTKDYKTGINVADIYSIVLGFIQAFEEFSENYFGVDYQELIKGWYTQNNYLERVNHIKQLATAFTQKADEVTKENWFNKVYVAAWNKQFLNFSK